MKFSIKDLFSKCDQICGKLRIWSYLLKKTLMENFIFRAVLLTIVARLCLCEYKDQISFFYKILNKVPYTSVFQEVIVTWLHFDQRKSPLQNLHKVFEKTSLWWNDMVFVNLSSLRNKHWYWWNHSCLV